MTTLIRDFRGKDFRRSADDELQFLHGIEIKPVNDTESGSQWSGDESCARRRADEREAPQVQTMRACARTLADDDIEFVILHRGIEDLFDGRLQTMDFIN